MQPLRPGSLAPDFTLTAHDGSLFSLTDELKRHPVILIFYTMDGSPNCDRLLCNVNEDVEEFERAGLKVVGINHAEPDAHHRYADRKHLKLPLLSDQNFRVSAAYNSLFSIGPIKAIRYTVVGIAQDGTIRYYQRGRPANAEIIAGMGVGEARPV